MPIERNRNMGVVMGQFVVVQVGPHGAEIVERHADEEAAQSRANLLNGSEDGRVYFAAPVARLLRRMFDPTAGAAA